MNKIKHSFSYKKKRKKQIHDFNNNIKSHNKDLSTYLSSQPINVNTNSWFDINKYPSMTHHKNIESNIKFVKEDIIKCQKIKMILTSRQKKILQRWFTASTYFYNECITYIRNKYTITKNEITCDKLQKEIIDRKINKDFMCDDFISLREKLKIIRDEIIEKTQLKNVNRNTKIQTHTLDYILRQLCSNIKSAKTNLFRRNIRHFKIKYWRHNRCSKTIEIEKCCVNNNKVCPHTLGNIRYSYNNEDVELKIIEHNVKINYNNITDEYVLLVPISENLITIKKENNMLSIDAGLNTFMTCISENGSIVVGKNVNKTISKDIKRLNKIKNNNNISKKIKKKNERIINRKINNRVDDLHWKTISYLVKNYNIIYLGNMSAKNICRHNNSVLSPVQKVACLRTKYYVFSQRLAYKCKTNNVIFKLVNESYTSKTCSKCANYKHNLGGSKIYICDKCDLIIDRDINGARNIYIKTLCE
jgi:transposase